MTTRINNYLLFDIVITFFLHCMILLGATVNYTQKVLKSCNWKILWIFNHTHKTLQNSQAYHADYS
jgi:hypothetical protein